LTQQSLVSISEASHFLGVSEVTLRQWTDEGKIKAFITPGGHRRYSKIELRKFVTAHQKVLGMKELVDELEETSQLLRNIDRESLKSISWYSGLSQESQKHLAELGRRLLDLIIQYIAEPSKREQTIGLARSVGYSFGELLVRLEIPLTDSVEAFIMHRDPIMNAVAHLMKKRDALNRRVVEAIPLMTHVMDEALVSLVAAYQQYRGGLEVGIMGDAPG
jgi:excisionase family DNA binding protein